MGADQGQLAAGESQTPVPLACPSHATHSCQPHLLVHTQRLRLPYCCAHRSSGRGREEAEKAVSSPNFPAGPPNLSEESGLQTDALLRTRCGDRLSPEGPSPGQGMCAHRTPGPRPSPSCHTKAPRPQSQLCEHKSQDQHVLLPFSIKHKTNSLPLSFSVNLEN